MDAIRNILNGYIYAEAEGAFGYICKSNGELYIEWYTCREEFYNEQKHRRRKDMLFSSKYNLRVISFMKEVEKRLKLPKKDRLKITEMTAGRTGNCLYIEISLFWMKKMHRRSLLTALLRAGTNYTGNFQNALYSVEYLSRTREAVEKFFKGYTEYNTDVCFTGWQDEFYEVQNIKLRKPRSKN